MKLSQDPQFTPEQELLLWAIRVDHTKDQRVAEILAAGVEWAYVRETAIQHGIIPLLYKQLKEEMADLVPLDELATLRALFVANAARNIRMTQHLLKVLDLLAGSGVEAMPFKGPVLAVQAYGDLSMRSFGDLDILIHTRDQDRIYQLMDGQVYILTRPGQNSLEERLRIFQQKDCRFSLQNTIFEIHWNIIEQLYAVPFDMDPVWHRSLMVSILGREMKTLSLEDTIIVLCFHGFKHGWQKLNWLADLIYTISNHPDLQWHDVIVRAETLGVKRIVLIGLFLAQKHGGATCGPEIETLFVSDTTIQNLASKIQCDMLLCRTLAVKPFLFMLARERFNDKYMFLFYYCTNKFLVFLKWIVRHITGIRTSPGEETG